MHHEVKRESFKVEKEFNLLLREVFFIKELNQYRLILLKSELLTFLNSLNSTQGGISLRATQIYQFENSTKWTELILVPSGSEEEQLKSLIEQAELKGWIKRKKISLALYLRTNQILNFIQTHQIEIINLKNTVNHDGYVLVTTEAKHQDLLPNH